MQSLSFDAFTFRAVLSFLYSQALRIMNFDETFFIINSLGFLLDRPFASMKHITKNNIIDIE